MSDSVIKIIILDPGDDKIAEACNKDPKVLSQLPVSEYYPALNKV
jgi:hypothetical protein